MLNGVRRWIANFKINRIFASYDKIARVLDEVRRIREQIDDFSAKSKAIQESLENNLFGADDIVAKTYEAILYETMIIGLYKKIEDLMATV